MVEAARGEASCNKEQEDLLKAYAALKAAKAAYTKKKELEEEKKGQPKKPFLASGRPAKAAKAPAKAS